MNAISKGLNLQYRSDYLEKLEPLNVIDIMQHMLIQNGSVSCRFKVSA